MKADKLIETVLNAMMIRQEVEERKVYYDIVRNELIDVSLMSSSYIYEHSPNFTYIGIL